MFLESLYITAVIPLGSHQLDELEELLCDFHSTETVLKAREGL